MKVVVVGGGSTYTPELVSGIARRTGDLPVSELVLLDPNRERLEVVGRFAAVILLATASSGSTFGCFRCHLDSVRCSDTPGACLEPLRPCAACLSSRLP